MQTTRALLRFHRAGCLRNRDANLRRKCSPFRPLLSSPGSGRWPSWRSCRPQPPQPATTIAVWNKRAQTSVLCTPVGCRRLQQLLLLFAVWLADDEEIVQEITRTPKLNSTQQHAQVSPIQIRARMFALAFSFRENIQKLLNFARGSGWDSQPPRWGFSFARSNTFRVVFFAGDFAKEADKLIEICTRSSKFETKEAIALVISCRAHSK